MEIIYHVAVIGCGQLGGRLAKELCRFFNSITAGIVSQVALLDGAVIDTSDVNHGQVYLAEDVGWHKSAVLAGVLRESFTCIPVHGYGNLTNSQDLNEWLGLKNCYSIASRVAVIFDMSNGNRVASRSVKRFFKDSLNCIVITPAHGTIHTAVKLAGTVISSPVTSSRKKTYRTVDAWRIVRLCLTKMAIIISEGRLENRELVLVPDGVSVVDAEYQVTKKVKEVRFAKEGEQLLCICVGCGGTGGNFIKEFVHSEMQMKEHLSLLMIDGDRVEEKNLQRQPFLKADLLQNKARCLKEDLLAETPELSGRLFDYPFYLDTTDDLESAIALTGYQGKILLVGAVDNHRARQVMEQFYHAHADIIYVDAANEWSNGEVVVSVKKAGKEISPLRSFYYPDVLTDTGLSASEQSCSVINESAPQHLCTNLASAQGVLGALSSVIRNGKVRGGIFYFDVFREYARFQEVWCCDFGR